MTELTCIGLMSGTSMDGIDAALMMTDGQSQIKQLCTAALDYDPRFQLLLKTAEYAISHCRGDLVLAGKTYPHYAQKYLANLSQAIQPLAAYLYGNEEQHIALQDIIDHSTLLHAQLVLTLLAKAKIEPAQVDLVGYHGQAMYHKPAQGISVIVGNGQLLANTVGITVINDFRANDVKNGGQGAPLAPIYHQALAVRDHNYPIAVVNCGGIANITVITGEKKQELIGFDVGPGNVLIDRYIRMHTGESMDKDGKYGKKGQVNLAVLQCLAEKSMVKNGENYLNQCPPKSFDPSDFILIPELDTLSFEDACATLEAFTAYAIVDAVKFIESVIPTRWVLAGGGWNNPVITQSLHQFLQNKIAKVEIFTATDIGWDSKYMEAEIFAYLAARSLQGLPLTYPQMTKVKSATLGGHAYLPEKHTVSAIVMQLLQENPAVLTGYCNG